MQKLSSSLRYAAKGVFYAFAKERNMKIHGAATLLVVAAAVFFKITPLEWAVILLAIGLVIALELINTAMEALVDLYTQEYRHLAAIAKDVAAGAVLFCSLIALIIGLIIFLPYITAFFRS
ncbi:MAG: diacylglycerol kinase family protein [Clostridiales bacterium]|nr:diacylglycerol kinase family protein [Clostridiales bacterium]